MRVTLFRDLPTEHWHSMERYADELGSALRQFGCEVESFVPERPLPKSRGVPNTFLNYGWRTLVYPRLARKHQGDVNHIIDHSYAHLIDTLDLRKTVVTCHDIAPLALNEGRGIARRLWDKSFRAMLRAASIIVDSAFTRDEILRFSDYPSGHIHVVPLAASNAFFERVAKSDLLVARKRYRLSARKIILHVGSCEPRKNVETILRALVKLGDLVFLQIGGRFSKAQMHLIDELNLRERVHQIPFVKENELRLWYQSAEAFVLPSFYEGFGLPVIEALASGVPVVCANASSLPEIAGDPAGSGRKVALLIDPHDPTKLADAIRSVLDDLTLAAELRQRGIERAKMFSWERTARETFAIYHEITKR